MRYLALAGVTFAYWMIVGFVWFFTKLSCGMGPDTPEACIPQADSAATMVVGFALMIYGLALGIFLHRHPPFGDS